VGATTEKLPFISSPRGVIVNKVAPAVQAEIDKLSRMDAQGNFVPVVTTAGNYKYLGRLVVGFNNRGEIVEVDDKLSGPIRVAGGVNPDAVFPEPLVQKLVAEPVEAALVKLAATIVGNSQVPLDGERGHVRTRETNLGDLIADSQFWQATQPAPSFGAPAPDVAIQNGGGIRNDDARGPGVITALDTFDIVPFSNFVCVGPNISPHLRPAAVAALKVG
jgi:5'-nucleotidase / UDP-sugar diphosphatase